MNCNTANSCDCEAKTKEKRKLKINKLVFWIGLILSIGFLSYFEISKYRAATEEKTECATSECAPGECTEEVMKEDFTT